MAKTPYNVVLNMSPSPRRSGGCTVCHAENMGPMGPIGLMGPMVAAGSRENKDWEDWEDWERGSRICEAVSKMFLQ